MFDYLFESSLRDDSNKWSNIEFGREIGSFYLKIHVLSAALLLLIRLVTIERLFLYF